MRRGCRGSVRRQGRLLSASARQSAGTRMRFVRHPFVDDVAGERFGVLQRGAATWAPEWASWTRGPCIDGAVCRATPATATSTLAAWRPSLAHVWRDDERDRIAGPGPVLQAFDRARRADWPDAWNSPKRSAVAGSRPERDDRSFGGHEKAFDDCHRRFGVEPVRPLAHERAQVLEIRWCNASVAATTACGDRCRLA